MANLFDPSLLERFPVEAGVYLMKDCAGDVLYVGKAKNLRSRVKNYFGKGGDGRAMIPFLVAKIATIDTIVVTSEKEALLLENTLIKRHQPPYNSIYRDDKSYVSLHLSTQATWPALTLGHARRSVTQEGRTFGPYTSATLARSALEILQKLFPLRQCSEATLARRTRPCILYQMKRCVAPCASKCTHDEYDSIVQRLTKFLSGSDRTLIDGLWQELNAASEELEFEKAGRLLSMVKSLESLVEKQRVDHVSARDCDVIALYRQADRVMITRLLYRGGKLTDALHTPFRGVVTDDEELLASFLLQVYEGVSEIPHEIILPWQIASQGDIGDILSASSGRKVVLHVPQKGDKKELVQMALSNAENAFKQHEEKEVEGERMLGGLSELCALVRYPARIECFDASHLSGSEPVVGLAAYLDGKKDSKRYRTYKVKEAKQGDDYGALEEVLRRRLTRGRDEQDLPDLIIVDGGKGQLSIAKTLLESLDIVSVDLISLSKDDGRHDKGITSETIHLPDGRAIHLPARDPLLFFLQTIRDEAHRFAITFQKKRRVTSTIKTELDGIPGIGPVKQKRLLKSFGSVKQIRLASDEALLNVPGISQKELLALRAALGLPSEG